MSDHESTQEPYDRAMDDLIRAWPDGAKADPVHETARLLGHAEAAHAEYVRLLAAGTEALNRLNGYGRCVDWIRDNGSVPSCIVNREERK